MQLSAQITTRAIYTIARYPARNTERIYKKHRIVCMCERDEGVEGDLVTLSQNSKKINHLESEEKKEDFQAKIHKELKLININIFYQF